MQYRLARMPEMSQNGFNRQLLNLQRQGIVMYANMQHLT